MKQVGTKRERELSPQVSGKWLAEGARFSESVARLAPTTFMPKGVYRYRSHDAANRHVQDCLAQGMGLEAGRRVKDALMVLPDQVARDIEPAWFEEGDNIRVADTFVVDLMLNANGQTYATLSQYAQTLDLDGIPVKTVNLEGLLLTKQTMRDKDMADRIVIERALQVFREQPAKP